MHIITLAGAHIGDVGKKFGFDMSDGWGAVIASVATGVFVLVAAYWAYKAGRRQVKDQAVVEHEQWLRGQRQEAYLGFLPSLDRLLRHAGENGDALDGRHADMALQGEAEPPRGLTLAEMEDADPRGRFGMELYEELDGVTLLGPDAVVEAGRAAADAVVQLGEALREGLAVAEGRLQASAWGGYLGPASVAADRRDLFAERVRLQVQSPAMPEGGRWWRVGR